MTVFETKINDHSNSGWMQRFFVAITLRPLLVVALGSVTIVLLAAGLKNLVKDTSVDALIPPDHESFEANQTSKNTFGIADPIIVAVLTDSVFSTKTLTLIRQLHQEIERLPNVRQNRVLSLASESSIQGDVDLINVQPYLDLLPATSTEMESVRSRWRAMLPHQGTLVSEDERGAIIAVELIDDRAARDSYAEIVALIERSDTHGHDIHISGMAAVSGFLSSSIDRDSRIMQPIVFLVVLLVVYVAFRSTLATILPLMVIIASAGGALGVMAWMEVPYFTITSALPVILVAVSVADAIHILTGYYIRLGDGKSAHHRELVVQTMIDMTPPITVTTLTTMAGFLGIGLADIMPPIRYFAYYAMLGVALAWLFSMIVLPNLIILAKPSPSRALAGFSQGAGGPIPQFFTSVGLFSLKKTGVCSVLLLGIVATALFGATHLKVDRALVEGFEKTASIRVADEIINERFAGTSFLDVMISTDEPEGLLSADRMKKMVELQEFMETLPHIQKTVAITDYISLLHGAMNNLSAGRTERPLPDRDDAIAQYLLVYEASGDPTDFEEEIDSAYQTALVRGYMNSRHYSQERATVQSLQEYVDSEFNIEGMTAVLSGRVNVRYHWLDRLAKTHFTGVGLSITMIFLLAAFLFRSFSTGLIAVIPVVVTVLLLYATMGLTGVYLEPATTMFAAISLGVGVDFAIHLVDRFQQALKKEQSMEAVIRSAMPETARACFFNALALGLGFSVLLFSELLTLKRFGGLVAVAAAASFLSALLIVPTLMVIRERIRSSKTSNTRTLSAGFLWIFASISMLGLLPFNDVVAEEALPSGRLIAEKVDQRLDGENVIRRIEMEMINRRGQTRTRNAIVLRHRGSQEHKSRVVYLEPKSVRETSFLSYDYRESGRTDDQWLYLPAMRKVRRIPASDRGDNFLGTDFTYDDIRSDLKFDLDDYNFGYEHELDDGRIHVITGTPKTEEISDALGYGGFVAHIDANSWLPVRIDFDDPEKRPLKSVEVLEFESIQGIWTPLLIEVVNHQTQHSTRFRYSDIRFPEQLPSQIFLPNQLMRGIPRL